MKVSKCAITLEVLKELVRWRDNILGVIASLYPTPEVDFIVLRDTTDTSNEDWGTSTNGQTISGRWKEAEKFLHINELELLAIRHAVF